MPTLLLDGAYARGVYVGRPKFEYPFSGNSDRHTFIVHREFRQSERLYERGQMGVLKDPKFGDAYLMTETDPAPTGIGDIISVTRSFARVPTQQRVPSSQYISKPEVSEFAAVSGVFADFTALAVGTTGTASTGASGPAYTYGDKTFTVGQIYSRLLGSSTVTPAAGGTFTLTFGADTTGALNWNDSGATIAAALNGLASVISAGLVFSVSNVLTNTNIPGLVITATSGTTAQPVTMNAGSLTPAGASTAFTQMLSLTGQNVNIASRVNLVAHGLDPAEPMLAFRANTSVSSLSNYTLIAAVTGWSVIDANTIAFNNFGQNAGTPYTVFGQLTGSYSGGNTLARTTRVTTYYLPGVTPGITTPDDIPLPANQGTPESLLAAILAGSTEINYEVGEIAQWRNSPFLARTVTTLNAATL